MCTFVCTRIQSLDKLLRSQSVNNVLLLKITRHFSIAYTLNDHNLETVTSCVDRVDCPFNCNSKLTNIRPTCALNKQRSCRWIKSNKFSGLVFDPWLHKHWVIDIFSIATNRTYFIECSNHKFHLTRADLVKDVLLLDWGNCYCDCLCSFWAGWYSRCKIQTHLVWINETNFIGDRTDHINVKSSWCSHITCYPSYC